MSSFARMMTQTSERMNYVSSTVGKAKSKTRYKLLLLVAPFVLIVLVFYYMPLYGWIYTLYNYKPGIPLFKCEFVGLSNIKQLFIDEMLPNVLRNTLVLSFLTIITTPVPVVFALLLTELGNKRFKKIVQTASTLPYYISWISVFSIAYAFFSNDGLVYQFMNLIGLSETSVNILGNERIAWFFQTALLLWKTTGYTAIIYFAAIAAVDTEQYSAAQIDGANKLQTIIYITLPGIASTYFVILLLTTANLLSNGFDQYFIFFNPRVAEKINVLDYYIYITGFQRTNDISYATTLGFFKTVISILLLFITNSMSKKLRGESLF